MYKQRALELFEEEQSKTKAAQRLAEEYGVEYNESFRKKVNKIIVDSQRNGETIPPFVKVNDFENETTTETSQYQSSVSNLPSAWSGELKRFYTIEEYCDVYGLDKGSVKSSKLVSHNASHMVYNIAFYTEEEEAVLDINSHLEEIIKKFIKPAEPKLSLFTDIVEEKYFDRLVYSDVHIGMDVQGKGGSPLYDGKWDAEEILKRLDTMLKFVLENKRSNTLYIDDLGDFLDGLSGQTTRKGHELPQNMTNVEAFELAVKFKVDLVDKLVHQYDKIICNNITNDNHSGDFAYFVSSAVKKILEQRYPNTVKVHSIQKFMHNYYVGKHGFILCHGKDIGEMKFGFKPKLDTIQSEKIDQYCKENKMYGLCDYIEFSKGDSHQAVYDDTTSNDFSYYNYPAFSPPSNWVKSNFKNTKSGFRFYNISYEENIKITYPYFFEN